MGKPDGAQTTPKRRTHQELEDLREQMAGMRRQLEALSAQPAQPPAAVAPEAPKKPRGFQPTAQHEAIFKQLVSDGPGMTVIAVAGAGKTSTLAVGSRHLQDARPDESIAFVAFSKSASETLRTKLPVGVRTSTIHSLCFHAVKKARGWKAAEDACVKKGRIRDAAWGLAKARLSGDGVPVLARDLSGLWSLALNTMTPMPESEALKTMAREYGADVEPDSAAFDLLPELDKNLRADTSTLSFDEMLRIVVEEELPLERVGTLLVDEAQDLNRIQMQVLAQIKPRQVVAVGDPKQSIYAFRGADHRAIDTLSRQFGITARLPLSTTYRCSKAIVREAQRLVRDIHALPDAPDGEVIERESEDLELTLAEMRPGDLILSRTNAPLMKALLRGRTKGLWQRACIIGGDDSDALATTIDRTARETQSTDNAYLAEVIESEGEQRALRMEESGNMTAALDLRDRTKTIAALLQATASIEEAKELLAKLTSKGIRKDSVNLSTIHKAKGLEADRVVLLGHNQIPNPSVLNSDNAALIAQEWNLLYVAITRARTLLIKQAFNPDDL